MAKREDNKETMAVIKNLLQKNHDENDINYGGFRANHVVHGVCTLYSLGAAKERIEEYFQMYLTIVEPLRAPKFIIDESNWENYISDKTAYAELLPFFDKEIKTQGVEKCLTKYIPRLLPGFIGGLYHPLIHIGFGLEYDFPGAVAEGLSYASTYYFKVGETINRLSPPDNAAASIEPLELVKEMKRVNLKLSENHNERFQVDEILSYHATELTQLASKWKINADSKEAILEKLTELTRAALIVTFGSYQRESIDFFLIHNVTTLQAVRVLLPYLSLQEQKRLLQLNLVGLLANYWLQGMPNFELERIMTYGEPEVSSWENIIQTSIACNDEHVCKVIRTLLVIKDSIPETNISHELLQRAGFMTTNLIKLFENWEFNGIGYDVPTSTNK